MILFITNTINKKISSIFSHKIFNGVFCDFTLIYMNSRKHPYKLIYYYFSHHRILHLLVIMEI